MTSVPRLTFLEYINTFVYEVGLREGNLVKHKKIDELRLSTAEWDHVKLFTSLLAVCHPFFMSNCSHWLIFQHADNAQQFSSDRGPSLQQALPALEALHKAWSSRSANSKYKAFHIALNAAIEKIKQYYDRTSESEAYIMAMCKLSSLQQFILSFNWTF